jgi:hypothetical protein
MKAALHQSMTREEAIAILTSPAGLDETLRVHRLARAVDATERALREERITRRDAEDIVDHVAGIAEQLFEGSRETFEVVYGRRLRRVIREVFGDGD